MQRLSRAPGCAGRKHLCPGSDRLEIVRDLSPEISRRPEHPEGAWNGLQQGREPLRLALRYAESRFEEARDRSARCVPDEEVRSEWESYVLTAGNCRLCQ